MLDDLTKAPVPVRIGDQTFEVSPLTQGDLGQLLRVVQFEPYYTLRELGDIPEEVLHKTLAECSAKKIPLSSNDFNVALETPWGMVEGVYLSLRHKHPDITREQIKEWPPGDLMLVISVASTLSAAFTVPEHAKKKLAELVEKFPQRIG